MSKGNAIEFSEHPWFAATEAHPEFRSRLVIPHPLFLGFIDVGAKFR